MSTQKASPRSMVTLLSLLVATRLTAADEVSSGILAEKPAHEAPEQESLMDLAEKTQNPVPDQIKLQFQHYFNFGVGPDDVMQYQENVIPTIPFKLTDAWNLVTRTTMPIINQPSKGPGMESAFGLGDINPQFYVVPREHGAFLWGLGPTFTLPTATESLLGSGKWSAGPGAVLVLMQGPWVVGTRVNNQWSFAGWRDHEVNQLWLQPFIHYNFTNGWYLATLPTYSANWTASSGDVWTVPV